MGECVRLSRNHKITKKHGINPYESLVNNRNGKMEFTGKVHFFEDRLEQPLHTRKPTVWFVNSLSDLYHREISVDMLKRIFAIMNTCERHIFDVLTKRTGRMLEVADKLIWTLNIWQGVSFEGIPEGMSEGQRKAILSRMRLSSSIRPRSNSCRLSHCLADSPRPRSHRNRLGLLRWRIVPDHL